MSPRRKPSAEPIPSESQLVRWPVDRLVSDPDNPRVDLGDITGLAQSISERGLLQPIIVRPGERTDEHGEMVIQAGHRRHAAVVSLGWTHVDVVVHAGSPTDQDRLVGMLVENIQRQDLTPIEEARGYKALVGAGMTQRQIATKTGSSQPSVSKRLGLLKLPEKVQQWVTDGTLAVDLATVLASLPADAVTRLCAASPPTEARIVDERRRLDRAKKIAQETDRLTAAGVTVVAAHQVPDGARRIGPGWNRVHVDDGAHQSEPCSIATLGTGFDGTIAVDWWCTEPDRHPEADDTTSTAVRDEDRYERARQLQVAERELPPAVVAARRRSDDLRRRRRERWAWLATDAPLPDTWAADAVSWMVVPANYEPADSVVLVDRLGLDPDGDMPADYQASYDEAGRRLTAWADTHGHDRLLWLIGCLLVDVIEPHTDDDQQEAGRRWLTRLTALGYEPEPVEWDAVGGPEPPADEPGGCGATP